MRKHKWRGRIVILVLLLIAAMVILSPDRKSNHQISDVTAAVPADNGDEEKKGEETVVGWMIDRIASGEVELSDENSIRQALSDAEAELSISLTEDDRDKIVGFLQTLGNIGVETEGFIDQAKQKYQQYSVEFVEEANEAINEAVESAVTGAAENFLDSIGQAVKDFFADLIPG